MLTRLQCRVKMKAFQFEALLGALHCLLPQLKRPLQTLTAQSRTAAVTSATLRPL